MNIHSLNSHPIAARRIDSSRRVHCHAPPPPVGHTWQSSGRLASTAPLRAQPSQAKQPAATAKIVKEQLSSYEVAAVNAVKVGSVTNTDAAAWALVHKIEGMDTDPGGDLGVEVWATGATRQLAAMKIEGLDTDPGGDLGVEVWATGATRQLAAMKVLCEAQSIASARGFAIKVVPFEDELHEDMPALANSKNPEEIKQQKWREKRKKVVWVVSKLTPPMDVQLAVQNAPILDVHRMKGGMNALLAATEEQLEVQEEGQAPQEVALRFMGEKPAQIVCKSMLKLFARAYNDDDYFLCPCKTLVPGVKDEKEMLKGLAFHIRRNPDAVTE
eukprot:gene3431-13478_t